VTFEEASELVAGLAAAHPAGGDAVLAGRDLKLADSVVVEDREVGARLDGLRRCARNRGAHQREYHESAQQAYPSPALHRDRGS
jgi:hypothetical protein